MLLRAPVNEVQVRDGIGSDRFVCLPQHYQLIGARVRQRAQQHAVDYTKDRRVGADANGQRSDSDQGEARLLHQHAGGIAQILKQCLHSLSFLTRSVSGFRFSNFKSRISKTPIRSAMLPSDRLAWRAAPGYSKRVTRPGPTLRQPPQK